ncbi:MAG TPA: AAA family ATPase [Steroidobacteraceae bacterium]|nr:AAA family ATPase [Steroidobacteraceae bacterium]
MQTPAAYAALHTVAGTIRCVETHVSWVFLTGTYAYKVKKPLRLSFLDYSTAARREWFCREELRLNRRHAPGLYVDTVPIGGRPDAPRVGAGDAPAFEHALRMVQFDPAQELTRLLYAHDVAAAEIANLGAELWRVHEEAARAEPAGPYGTPATVHRVTLDNFDEIARALPASHSLDLAAMRVYVEHAFARLAPRMDLRKSLGYVRECHGDLHCGNIVRWDGRLVAFDGLEFDPALRFIDVASDLAFPSMDLSAHERADLRRTLLDAWTAASGDYAAVELLPYYETYRALVRAKVAALRGQQARDATITPASPAFQYLDWARRQSTRRAPTLVVMAGLSGSGKTWLARRIAEAVDALHVRSDVERKRLAGLAPLANSRSAPDAGIYTREFNLRTYARLRECVRSCLQGGESVVMDAANLRRDERAAFVRIAADLGANAHLVHCQAPLDVLRERIVARSASGADASEATAALLERQPSCWEPVAEAERTITVDVDTSRPEQVDAVLLRLSRAARRER